MATALCIICCCSALSEQDTNEVNATVSRVMKANDL